MNADILLYGVKSERSRGNEEDFKLSIFGHLGRLLIILC